MDFGFISAWQDANQNIPLGLCCWRPTCHTFSVLLGFQLWLPATKCTSNINIRRDAQNTPRSSKRILGALTHACKESKLIFIDFYLFTALLVSYFWSSCFLFLLITPLSNCIKWPCHPSFRVFLCWPAHCCLYLKCIHLFPGNSHMSLVSRVRVSEMWAAGAQKTATRCRQVDKLLTTHTHTSTAKNWLSELQTHFSLMLWSRATTFFGLEFGSGFDLVDCLRRKFSSVCGLVRLVVTGAAGGGRC